jgi:hypothetical protein
MDSGGSQRASPGPRRQTRRQRVTLRRRELGVVPELSMVLVGAEGILVPGVMVGSTFAVGPLLCDQQAAPAPQGQGSPAALRLRAAQGAHCHD